MIYLFLAALSSASIALIFKYSGSKEWVNKFQVTSFNYLTATTISLVMLLKSGQPILFSGQGFLQCLVGNFNGNITVQGSWLWAIILGVATGILYLLGFLLYQSSIKSSGASLSGMFNKMGIIVPMVFSMIVWREFPSALQLCGILLSLSAIIMVNFNFDSGEKSSIKPTLLIMFLVVGFGEFSNKLFQKYAMAEMKSHFMLVLFATALIISIGLTVNDKNKAMNIKSALCGVAVGVPNMLSTLFLIEALNKLPATVVYPIYSAGSIVIIMATSFVIFGEKLKKKEIIAMVVTLIALSMVNI
ncbi:Small Multidrug Resistance protein [Hathewaya proteolytica DSM 3090]|uniref:Small Multidrug Resistance protein n=1 Tax=Hathewaya proteolytica DSM 3090 TaxID=1121331 RepID=A0A1M6QJ74_9CLOT|nr:SMR family transporter [Hathewaya proteolytica]SHK20291.1 Small Multidrug Resistance protein [Hathewaya proteolytica DSM 3090]